MNNADQLALRCVENINFHTTSGLPAEEAGIMITTPKGWMAPPKFPRRQLTTVNPNTGDRVYRISAVRLLAYLIGNNLTTIKIEMKALK
ncbi:MULTISPECIES: hypothetical protein [unclassified Bradyrhizobium]|uniref:hypothetical protein n=1 Tax=unclassified Bradyrhizobium TaxID=2631580 RepID=UPI0029166520|nr:MULTISPECIES: hypothetical protein [unclassified Bradyrhizobium]